MITDQISTLNYRCLIMSVMLMQINYNIFTNIWDQILHIYTKSEGFWSFTLSVCWALPHNVSGQECWWFQYSWKQKRINYVFWIYNLNITNIGFGTQLERFTRLVMSPWPQEMPSRRLVIYLGPILFVGGPRNGGLKVIGSHMAANL